jgi:pimeloyl-ACP methyl ester carboxylesterase
MKKLGRILLFIGGALLLVVLVGPFLVPIPPLEDVVPPRQLADPDSRFMEANGLDVHYKEAGQGEPALVLLHGFASSLFTWRDTLAPLSAAGRRVIAFDRPAFGLSERPMTWEGSSPYSTESHAELTSAVMEEAGLEQAVLVGNSAGGTVAMLTALRDPQRVRALVLVSPAVYQDGGGATGWLNRIPQMQRLGPLLARNIQRWGRNFAGSAWHDPDKITDEIWAGYTKPLQAENWDRALWYTTLARQDLDLEQEFDRLTLPVLVITGDDDRVVPTADSVRLADELPNAELVVIPNCGHAPQEECPEEFLQAVESFLARLPE